MRQDTPVHKYRAEHDSGSEPPGTDTDVVVVGNGPVGATLSVLLAQRGWRVTVLERRPRPYRLPRATSFDGETARLLAATGIGPELAAVTEAANGYQWRTATEEVLLDIVFTTAGRYGWPDVSTTHQPALEELLATRAAALPGVTVLRGYEVVGITDGEQRAEVVATTDDGSRLFLSTRWVVGCDGANSFVRDHLDVEVTDLGFSYEWLLCDVELHEPREFVPTNVQICDPARPTTLVGSGPGRRRWEFMRLPGESTAELNRDETAWRLLEPFGVTPANATLSRSTTYLFHARWAGQWRVGRVLLAGDAAHLMPPFAGQGMCSGIRDVANLAWKLDLILRGVAGDSLVNTYVEERRLQARAAILSSVQLGRMICVTDPSAAAERDATVLAGRRGRESDTTGGPEPAKPLETGFLYQKPGVAVPPAGEVMPQGRVRRLERGSAPGLFDDVVGRGFALLTTEPPHTMLDEDRLSFLAGLPTRVVQLLSPDTVASAGEADGSVLAVVDLDELYRTYLAQYSAAALLVRPDHHVYGAANTPGDVKDLVDGLRTHLTAREP